MTTKQIALQVMAHRGLKAMDGALVLTMTRRVGASLRRQWLCAFDQRRPIRRKYDLWEIAR